MALHVATYLLSTIHTTRSVQIIAVKPYLATFGGLRRGSSPLQRAASVLS
jgi:hypothetical protein